MESWIRGQNRANKVALLVPLAGEDLGEGGQKGSSTRLKGLNLNVRFKRLKANNSAILIRSPIHHDLLDFDLGSSIFQKGGRSDNDNDNVA